MVGQRKPPRLSVARIMKTGYRWVLSSLVLLGLTACSGGSGNGDANAGLAIPPHNVVVTHIDASGDARGGGGTAWDITQVQTTLLEGPFRDEYVTLNVAVTFSQDVSSALPVAGASLADHPELLGVGILLNTDGNSTGASDYLCSSSPNISGIDAYVDPGTYQGRRANGSFPILDANGIPKDEATVSVAGHTITYTINLAAWGSPPTGLPNTSLAVIALNGANGGTQTDCAPDASTFRVSAQ